MLQPLSWQGRDERRENPFSENNVGPLKITLHSSSFAALVPDQNLALELLRELSELDELDVLETAPDAAYTVVIAKDARHEHYDVSVRKNREWAGSTGVSVPEQQLRTAQSMAGIGDPNHPDVQAALSDVLVAEAHRSLRRHLLVTESRWLLDPRWQGLAHRANAQCLADVMQLLGLFLRRRNKYLYRARAKSIFEPVALNRSLYYLVLARNRTPSMWKYNAACGHFRDTPDAKVATKSWSIVDRCKRALQARDQMADAFYAPSDDQTNDVTAYHFDYLTLLLVGALDAEARIAHRVYRMPGSDRVSFRDLGFINALRKAGASQLYDILVQPRVRALITLLFDIRNTIHEASLSASGFHTTGNGPGWFELDEGKFATDIWLAAEQCGGADDWGLKKMRFRKGEGGPIVEPIQLHPYPYARQLVQQGVDLVDQIAGATEIERLFNDGPIPELMTQPPEDGAFREEIRTRLALLG
jgi:hypothetical protein